MEKLITLIIIFTCSLIGAVLGVPIYIYVYLMKEWNWKEIIKLYKYIWESK